MGVKDKLEKYNFFDQLIIRHGMLEHIRDYEIIGQLDGRIFGFDLQYIFKGCIKSDFQIKVAPKDFSLDERLLDLTRQNEPNYPQKFIWGVNFSVVYPGWTLFEHTDELKELEKLYGIKFYKIHFETNAYDLMLIFHDVEIKQMNRIEKFETLHNNYVF